MKNEHIMPTALIVLAAGQGTRMNSDLPKVLHRLGGVPLFAHALSAARPLGADKTILVVGHKGEEVAKAARDLDPEAVIVDQPEQNGTADAVKQARASLADFEGDVVVLYGDTPFIRPETLANLARARARHDVVVLGFRAQDPGRYGRLVMDGDRLDRIVEFKDADAEQRKIDLCNSGIMMAHAEVLFDLLEAVNNDNASGEYYLTDIVEIAASRGLSATAVTCQEHETLGINTRQELARAEAEFQARARAEALENGVTMTAPETVFLALDTHLGRDVTIEPHVVFGPGVTVENQATVRAFSHLEGCHVGAGAIVGPYARLRPGAELSNDVRIGNFVEIKNARIGDGAKVNHLSYIGDAEIGEKSNIGAGTVTCNYDGVNKHRTTIGRNVFVGSDTMLVAPVKLGDNSMTASGSVINRDVPEGSLGIARAAQENIAGFARRWFEKLKSRKEKQQKGSD